MSRAISLLGVVALFVWCSAAQAHVSSGGTCSNCHSPATGRTTVTAPATTNGTSDPGVPVGLPVFSAHPGDTVALPIQVTNGGSPGDLYAVAMSGLNSGTTIKGLLNSADILTLTPDATWAARGSGTGSYATVGPATWTGSATTYTYSLKLSAAVPTDYYRLTLISTGVDTDMWTQAQDVVVHVTAIPEPASLALIGLPAGLLLMRRRMMTRVA